MELEETMDKVFEALEEIDAKIRKRVAEGRLGPNPNLVQSRVKNRQIHLMIDSISHTELTNKANKMGITLSEYCRRMLCRQEISLEILERVKRIEKCVQKSPNI